MTQQFNGNEAFSSLDIEGAYEWHVVLEALSLSVAVNREVALIAENQLKADCTGSAETALALRERMSGASETKTVIAERAQKLIDTLQTASKRGLL